LRIQINQILLIASLLSVAALVSQAPSGAFAADLLDRGPVKFNILNREGTATIGSSTYTADRNPDRIVLRGENRYLNGEFDLETEVFSPDSAGGFPNLVSFGHSFYNADGTPRLESHADFGSGIASCVEYRGPNLEPQVRTAAITFPSDTWAGASILLPIEQFLRGGGAGKLTLHVFSCAPSPKVFTVTITSAGKTAPWRYSTAEPMQIDAKPDFGWLNILVAPFVPKLRAWFDPAHDWTMIGVSLARYYGGPEILMIRDEHSSAPGTSDAHSPPQSMSAPR